MLSSYPGKLEKIKKGGKKMHTPIKIKSKHIKISQNERSVTIFGKKLLNTKNLYLFQKSRIFFLFRKNVKKQIRKRTKILLNGCFHNCVIL